MISDTTESSTDIVFHGYCLRRYYTYELLFSLQKIGHYNLSFTGINNSINLFSYGLKNNQRLLVATDSHKW